MAASKSGLHLQAADIPIVLGMVARGDRKQDIAAWFDVNPARIQEAINGDYGTPPAAAAGAHRRQTDNRKGPLWVECGSKPAAWCRTAMR